MVVDVYIVPENISSSKRKNLSGEESFEKILLRQENKQGTKGNKKVNGYEF